MSLSKSACDRVFFDENIMHMILPYISSIKDLKSVRLVTPLWNKIGTKLLGRKSFKPIRFTDITQEDWLTLKREIEASRPEQDPRIKFFQGFHLTWADVVLMDNYDLMSPFKPSQIIIEDRDVPPGPSLISILTPILDTLVDLTLNIESINDFSFLENLAQLQGMRLKRFHLETVKIIWTPESTRIIARIFNDLLACQAPTLEELNINIICVGKDYEGPIQLSIFHRLTSFTLGLQLEKKHGFMNNFAPFDFGEKFPNLQYLEFDCNFLWEMSGDNEELGREAQDNIFELTRGNPLKKMKINYSQCETPIEYYNKLLISFPFVEEFSAHDLSSDGAEIPWVDTLRNLEIFGFSPTFNLVHLKKIENLHYTVVGGRGCDVIIEDVNGTVNMLLEHYRELPLLKKFHISGFKAIITAQQVTQIQEALPAQLLDILTID